MIGQNLWRAFAGVALLVIWLSTGGLSAQAAPIGPSVVAQGVMPVTVPAGEASIVSVVLDFAPGAQVPEHVHGGPLVVTILSGALTLSEDSGTTTYKAGEYFTEMPNHKHVAMNMSSGHTVVGVSALLAKGAELQTLTDEGSKQTGVTPPAVVYQAAYPLTLPAEEANLIGLVLDFSPGAGVPNHVHGGPLIVQVLSGEITLTEDGGVESYKAGEMWTETTGHVHNAFNLGNTSTRVLVSALIPEGSELQTLVDQPGGTPAGMPVTGAANAGWPIWGALLALVALLVGLPLRKRNSTS